MDPGKSGVKLAFVDKNAGRRLRWIDAVREQFSVVIVPSGKDPVRIVRDQGVGLLIVVETSSKKEGLRVIRGAKTERRPSLVGVVSVGGEISQTEAEGAGADGYLSGEPTISELLNWLSDIQGGHRPSQGSSTLGLRDKAKLAIGLLKGRG